MEDFYEKDKLADCSLEERSFPNGYYRCKEGKCMTCYDGSWEESDAPHLVEKGHFEM